MNCFVIMPFARDFDDVYSTIKSTVSSVLPELTARCIRLDEDRPAGRITDRLLLELQAATICVADLTGCKPNVMWEVGYAMALEKPTLFVTQSIAEVPFDIKDMMSIEYSRSHLSTTLAEPLRKSLFDTLSRFRSQSADRSNAESRRDALVPTLLNEIASLKSIVAEAVAAWPTGHKNPGELPLTTSPINGTWVDLESGTRMFARTVNGELVCPYAYGTSGMITGVYFGWRKMGEYWFARYRSLSTNITGFTFLRLDTADTLEGAWWPSSNVLAHPLSPPSKAGSSARWKREENLDEPDGLSKFFASVGEEGLAGVLARHTRVE